MRTQPTQEDIISAVRRHFAAEEDAASHEALREMADALKSVDGDGPAAALRRYFAAEDAYVGASGLLNDSAAPTPRMRERRDAALADRDAAYGALRGLAGGGR